MPVKSVIDVEVNDEQFKEFSKLFEKYQSALGMTPGMWASTEKASAGTALNVENLVAALLTHEAINRKIAREEEDKRKKLEAQNRELAKTKIYYKDIARTVTSVFATVAKWASYAGAAGGLVGFGGLLGLENLASFAGSGRRQAQGLGASIGETKAFENAYSRILGDTGGLLSGVNAALTDVSKRAPLLVAGISPSDIASGDSAQVSLKLLDSVKRLVDKTPTDVLASVAQGRGLDQLGFTTEALRALKATTPKEYNDIRNDPNTGYLAKVKQFALEDDVARKWQDLGVQLGGAKTKIELALINGLTPLTGPLTRLSGHVADAITSFLKNLDPKTIDDIGQAIDDFGKYLGSPKFRNDLKTFSDDVSYAAKKIVDGLRFLGLIPDAKQPDSPELPDPTIGDRAKSAAAGAVMGGVAGGVLGGFVGGPAGAVTGARFGASAGGALGATAPERRLLGEQIYGGGAPNWTNPGNIKIPGTDVFARFATQRQGTRAIARQLGLYENRDHLDTIAKIIAKYAPKGVDRNNVAAYVKDVSARTGIDANKHLNLADPDVLAKVVSAITKHEGRLYVTPEQVKAYVGEKKDDVDSYVNPRKTAPDKPAPKAIAPAAKPQPAKVSITINNNTGGSAVVQSNMAAKQG